MADLMTSGRSAGQHGARRMPLRVDLTAMVDLAFLLITFFMLTTVLSRPQTLKLAMPVGDKAGPVPETRTMTICLGKNNQALWYLGLAAHPILGPANINVSALTKAIIETGDHVYQTSGGKGMIVIVKPSAHSVYDNLVQTLDDLNVTGVPSYSITKLSKDDARLLQQHHIF